VKLYRPTIWGWWAIEAAASLGYSLANSSTLLGGVVFWVGFLASTIALMIAGSFVGPSLIAQVKRKPPPPDPISQMAAFKAARRKQEIAAWNTAYCDALGFGKDEYWHRLSAVQHAARGETYHHVRRRA
jgi:hypothetical protein